jgi:cbb3-type cytochrome oxidase maturation protein
MEILYLLVPMALVFLAIALKFLFWAVNNGQYDDLDTEGYRILFDDDQVSGKSKSFEGASSKSSKAKKDSNDA